MSDAAEAGSFGDHVDAATEMASQATIRSIPMVLGGAEVEGLAALAVKMTAAERCWLLGPKGW